VNQEQRDLALDDLWADSLERSLARRGARPRDLADAEHVLDSLSVAQRRREAAASQTKLPAPAARGLSLTALLAVTAGPAVGATVAFTGTASAATVVEKGDKGHDVKKLQRALGVHADGIFGPGTKKALRKFQARNGLHVDGVAGPATWSALKRADANTSRAATKTVKVGGKARIIGHSVRAVQHELGVPADGVFGPQSLKALKRFQSAHGLDADGIVGPATWRALVRDGGSSGSSGGGKRSARAAIKTEGSGVEALQRALGIGADGDFGPATESALKRWQASRGLEADGVAGPATRSALGLGDGPVLKRGGSNGKRGGNGGDDAKIAAMISAGNRIASTPYIYGGGHGSFESSGYDCSGSVSYVLHGAGLLDSPLSSGGFMSWGEPGPGQRVTIYANAGHAYMVIDGRRFDTSGASAAGTRWQPNDRSSAGYVAVHPPGL
jgi:peptidoglycan hydrolase-like protein with peptidoglycan-binding domain